MDVAAAKAMMQAYARMTKAPVPTLHRVIGQGQYGTVFGATYAGAAAAVKVTAVPLANFAHEVEMQKRFARKTLAPKVRASFFVQAGARTYGVIVMDKVDGTVGTHVYRHPRDCARVAKLILHLLGRLRSLRLVHGDMHLENIAIVRAPELQVRLIDFGGSYRVANNARNSNWEKYNASMAARGAPKCLADAGLVVPEGFPGDIRDDVHYLQVYQNMHAAVSDARRRVAAVPRKAVNVGALNALNARSPPREPGPKSSRNQLIANAWFEMLTKK